LSIGSKIAIESGKSRHHFSAHEILGGQKTAQYVLSIFSQSAKKPSKMAFFDHPKPSKMHFLTLFGVFWTHDSFDQDKIDT
jgi:hypothetical protein